MKVLTVVGARPQFIKAYALSPRLREAAQEVLVHTGQHYDRMMSGIFFADLELPRPDYELGVGSGTPGDQTGRMLSMLDEVISREKPNVVLVYGDTNSTLAGALAAVKLHVPVAHVEAGLRSFNRAMPEEINRVVTDHVASRLYCPTRQAVRNLENEGISDGVLLTGDVMDVALQRIRWTSAMAEKFGLSAQGYYVATVHRQENTDEPERLTAILQGLAHLDVPVVLPLHPRTRERIRQFGIEMPGDSRLMVIDPLGYQDMIGLVDQSAGVLTDSGGLQREAAALGRPCYVLRDETEWVELVEDGRAVLVGADPGRIIEAVAQGLPRVGRDTHGDRLSDPVAAIVADMVATWGD